MNTHTHTITFRVSAEQKARAASLVDRFSAHGLTEAEIVRIGAEAILSRPDAGEILSKALETKRA